MFEHRAPQLLALLIVCLSFVVQPLVAAQSPAPSAVDWERLRAALRHQIEVAPPAYDLLQPDRPEQSPEEAAASLPPVASFRATMVHLAWQCMSTFRLTSSSAPSSSSSAFEGGCDGARIRFAPEATWPENARLSYALIQLQPVRIAFPAVSWADLIVAAGTVALEDAGVLTLPFCAGRTDADAPSAIAMRPGPTFAARGAEVRAYLAATGLTLREWVALAARPRSRVMMGAAGYAGTWAASSPLRLSNAYFRALLGEQWEAYADDFTRPQFRAVGKPTVVMTPLDLDLIEQPDAAAIVREFAADNARFLAEFAVAWTRRMNADRGSACH